MGWGGGTSFDGFEGIFDLEDVAVGTARGLDGCWGALGMDGVPEHCRSRECQLRQLRGRAGWLHSPLSALS